MGKRADIAINIVTKGAMLAKRQLGALGKVAGKLGGIAKRVAQIGMVALTVAVSKAVKSFIEFDDAMVQSLAIMKTTEEQQERMNKMAREVALVTRKSIKDAADSYFFLASAGLDADQAISALPQVTAFAQAGMFDMATATDLATDAQSALGLTVKDATENLDNLTRVTDVLVKANQLANASVQQFSEALTTKSGAALKVVNKDIEEGVAVLAAFADRGVKGAEAGDKLNQVLRDIPRATSKNKSEFKALGLEMFDAHGNMKNVADIIEELDRVLKPMSDELKASTLDQLGLNRGVADAIKILSGAGNQIREYEAQLRSAGGATQSVAENQMKSIQAELDVTGSAWTELGVVLMQKFDPAMRNVLSGLQATANFLSSTFANDIEEAGDYIRNFGKEVAFESGQQRRYATYLDQTSIEFMSLQDSIDDNRTAVERYNSVTGKNIDILGDLNKKTQEQIEKERALAKARYNSAIPSLMAVVSASQKLEDIEKNIDDLRTRREKAEEDKKAIINDQAKAIENLSKAQEARDKIGDTSKQITAREELAILRQQEAVKELTEEQDGSREMELQLIVAKQRLADMTEEYNEKTKEELRAIQDVEKAKHTLEMINLQLSDSEERLTQAQKELNKATANTPANMLEIASAKHELNLALEDVRSMNLFSEGIQQMVDMGVASFDELNESWKNMMIGAGVWKGSGATSEPVKYSTEGSPVPDSSQFTPTGATLGSKAGGTTILNINTRVDSALTNKLGIEQAVASALVQAQRNGISVSI